MKKVSVLLPYANPHVLDWVLKMYNFVELNVGCIGSTQDFRPGYFKEYDELEGVKYFYKNDSDKREFEESLRDSDVLITLGIFTKELLLIAKYCKPDTRLIVLSEPFNPINSKKKTLLRRLWAYILRTRFKKIDFFCIGGVDVKDYYCRLGFEKSAFYNFGYFPDLTFYPPPYKTDSDSIIIGYIGQLIDRKGIDRLFGLIEYLGNNTEVNYTLLIAGDGEYRVELMNKIDALQTERIKYLGLISTKADVEEFLEQVDVLFVPSYFDGWGAVVSEGISKSCAIVASNKVYAAKSMVGNTAGFVFENDFISCFERYFKDRGLLVEHQNNCSGVFSMWNAQSAAQEVASFIREEVGGGNIMLRL